MFQLLLSAYGICCRLALLLAVVCNFLLTLTPYVVVRTNVMRIDVSLLLFVNSLYRHSLTTLPKLSVAFFRFKDTGLQWFFALGGMSFCWAGCCMFVHVWDVVRLDVIIGSLVFCFVQRMVNR